MRLWRQRVNSGLPSIRSPVAQLVEQAAVNRLVAGSSPARGAKSHSGHRTHVRWLFSSSPPQPFDKKDQRVGAAWWLAHHPSKSSSILGIREGAASPLLPASRRVSEHSLLVLQARRPLRDTTDLHFDAVRCLLGFAPDFAATLLTNDRTKRRRSVRPVYPRRQHGCGSEGGRTQPATSRLLRRAPRTSPCGRCSGSIRRSRVLRQNHPFLHEVNFHVQLV